VTNNKFVFEEYQVTTSDGYILSLHRLYEPGMPTSNPYPPVLLQHGIEDSSIQWVINDPEKSPAFILAKEGFDVWLGNNRGNHYSMKHVKYSPD